MVEDIAVTVRRKKIKNMYLRVLSPTGKVLVTSPLRTSQKELSRFVASNLDWLKKKQQAILSLPQKREHFYVTGESITVWGKKYTILLKETEKQRAVCKEGVVLVLYAPKSADKSERQAIIAAWQREELERAISFLRDDCENIVGKTAAEYRIRSMKTRWGTCNATKRRIWINLELVNYPLHCLRYIMLHELTHLWEQNHGPNFHALMDKFCPNWRAIRKELQAPGT